MIDKKIKLMNRDTHYLLPNFYSKPLLDMKGSPQRVGIFESKEDIFNFIYDLLIGVRSHSKKRGKIRKIINFYPGYKIKKVILKIVNKTFIGSN